MHTCKTSETTDIDTLACSVKDARYVYVMFRFMLAVSESQIVCGRGERENTEAEADSQADTELFIVPSSAEGTRRSPKRLLYCKHA